MAIAGLILGIIGLVGGPLAASIGLPLWLFSLVGLILSVIARKKAKAAGQPTGMATVGMILSIIGLVSGLVLFLACMVCAGAAVSSFGSMGF